MPDPWKVLYLRPDAPREVAEAAYKALVRIAHPDRPTGSTEAMAAINSAWDAINGQLRGWKPPEEQNDEPPSASVVMPWGKHSGKELRGVPSDYLRWALSQDWLDDDLRADMESVIGWRRK